MEQVQADVNQVWDMVRREYHLWGCLSALRRGRYMEGVERRQ